MKYHIVDDNNFRVSTLDMWLIRVGNFLAGVLGGAGGYLLARYWNYVC